MWNDLPVEIRSSPSKYSFEKNLKIFLQNNIVINDGFFELSLYIDDIFLWKTQSNLQIIFFYFWNNSLCTILVCFSFLRFICSVAFILVNFLLHCLYF